MNNILELYYLFSYFFVRFVQHFSLKWLVIVKIHLILEDILQSSEISANKYNPFNTL